MRALFKLIILFVLTVSVLFSSSQPAVAHSFSAGTVEAINAIINDTSLSGPIFIRLTGNISASSTPPGQDELFFIPNIPTAKHIILDGNGFTISRVAGSPQFRFFNNQANSTLVLNNITLSGGTTYNGGAIVNYGLLEINNSTISDNTASSGSSGGAIFNATPGRFIINTTTFSNNLTTVSGAESGGGAIYHASSQTLFSSITNSLFSNNTSNQHGAGVFLYDQARANISNSTFYGNTGGIIDGRGGQFI